MTDEERDAEILRLVSKLPNMHEAVGEVTGAEVNFTLEGGIGCEVGFNLGPTIAKALMRLSNLGSGVKR